MTENTAEEVARKARESDMTIEETVKQLQNANETAGWDFEAMPDIDL